MKKITQIALGIVAAIGGYVDIGDLVFNVQAGARFGYQLLWAVPLGVVGIVVFAEMSGRVAAIHRKANFELVRERFSSRLALATLIARRLRGLDRLGRARPGRAGGPRRGAAGDRLELPSADAAHCALGDDEAQGGLAAGAQRLRVRRETSVQTVLLLIDGP